MRIGIFGGSFNPIHNGHIEIARKVVELTSVDEVWFMVSPHNPLKEQTALMDDQLRLEMTAEALRNEESLVCSDHEFHLPRPSYTWNTLQSLASAYPEHSFSLVIGADNWVHFDKWRNHEEILRNHEIIVYPRRDCPINAEELPSGVEYLDIGLYDISSTMIRERLKQGIDIAGLVPQNVAEKLKTIE